MTYKLSQKSLNKLKGVKPELKAVVTDAIKLTKIDFGVTQGKRTLKQQEALVAKGASQTLKSKHLTGDAVDVVAYLGQRISWELNLYDDIAEAFREAAIMNDVALRWGAAWHINDIRKYQRNMEKAMMDYIDLRRKQGRRPFIDAPHFELT